jgi:hypothetical protein
VGRLLASTVVAVAVLCCAPGAGVSAAKSRPQQQVTLFSDSVGAALDWDSTAKRVLEHGNHVRFELHPCGRLVQPGCFVQDPAPSVLALVRSLGRRIGPTAVVFVGYNDEPATYRKGLPAVMRALRNHGVEHVLWLTLRAVNRQYVDVDHAIYAAERTWQPLLTVLDWNHYSAGHPSWFASDHVHMSGAGAVAFATYLHRSLKRLGLTGPRSAGR